MEKKGLRIGCICVGIAFFVAFITMFIINSINDVPHDEDYCYDNCGLISKIEEGSIREDETFAMEHLIYPEVKWYKDYDDYILAYQVPDIDDCFYRHTVFSTHEDSVKWMQYDDSVNKWLDKIQKLPECYWIIHKRTKKVYGPLTETEFNKLCIKLDVKKKNKNGKCGRVYFIGR